MLKQKDVDRLLPAGKAAEIKGLSIELFRYYLKKGRGPRSVEIDGRHYFQVEDLDHWDHDGAQMQAGRPRKK